MLAVSGGVNTKPTTRQNTESNAMQNFHPVAELTAAVETREIRRAGTQKTQNKPSGRFNYSRGKYGYERPRMYTRR